MTGELEEQSDGKLNWDRYRTMLSRRRWWLALPTFGVWVIVWAGAWFLPATYRSETLILVEQQKVPEQYVMPNVEADLQVRLQSMTQQILSRTRLLRIMEDLNLYAGERNKKTSDDLVERMRKDIQIELVESPGRRELNAFKIAYVSRNPKVAQQVTSQLSWLFIEENLKARQQQSESTTEFLESQLADARQNLSAQEQRIKDFKSRYLGELPGQVGGNVQILSGLQMRLQQEMEALGHAKQQSVYLESLLSQYRAMFADLQQGKNTAVQTPPAIEQELDRLRAKLADLSSHYTERHPDIRKLKEQIARTEQMKQQLGSKLASAGASPAVTYGGLPGTAPAMEIESQLKANRLEIENRQKSIEQLQRQIDEYQGRLNTTPLREQQLADLTRDYDQSRKNYEALLAKRDQSEMATNLERRQQGEQFRVLDPPNLPQKPYSPNRLKLALIGLVAGVLLGAGATAAREATDDCVYGKEDLASVVNAPVLVEIPPLRTADEQHQFRVRRWLGEAALVGMVLFTVAGLGASYYFG